MLTQAPTSPALAASGRVGSDSLAVKVERQKLNWSMHGQVANKEKLTLVLTVLLDLTMEFKVCKHLSSPTLTRKTLDSKVASKLKALSMEAVATRR